jgi:beta-glucosidase-like glycosyl hydrolase
VSQGQSWNTSLWYDIGSVVGLELRSLWLQQVGENHANNLPHLGLDCWSPNININRDPRWGRNQEVVSEDPLLSGFFGSLYTRGLQEGEDDRYLQSISTLKVSGSARAKRACASRRGGKRFWAS